MGGRWLWDNCRASRTRKGCKCFLERSYLLRSPKHQRRNWHPKSKGLLYSPLLSWAGPLYSGENAYCFSEHAEHSAVGFLGENGARVVRLSQLGTSFHVALSIGRDEGLSVKSLNKYILSVTRASSCNHNTYQL